MGYFVYIGYQFYNWIIDDVTPSYDEADKARLLKQQCLNAISCNNKNASSICSEADNSVLNTIEGARNATKKAAFLPGTLGGGPLPANLADIVSSEIVTHLRNESENN